MFTGSTEGLAGHTPSDKRPGSIPDSGERIYRFGITARLFLLL